jgi:hypothetical protein
LNRLELKEKTLAFLGWCHRLWTLPNSPTEPADHKQDANHSNPDSHHRNVAFEYCRHSSLRKAASRLTYRLFRRRQPLLLKNGCPVCGQLPAGDRVAEYVLTVWFIDGEGCEYHFRGRRENQCFEITQSILKVFLNNSVLHYPLPLVGTIEFSVRAVPKSAPEVAEAESIIGSRRSQN